MVILCFLDKYHGNTMSLDVSFTMVFKTYKNKQIKKTCLNEQTKLKTKPNHQTKPGQNQNKPNHQTKSNRNKTKNINQTTNWNEKKWNKTKQKTTFMVIQCLLDTYHANTLLFFPGYVPWYLHPVHHCTTVLFCGGNKNCDSRGAIIIPLIRMLYYK